MGTDKTIHQGDNVVYNNNDNRKPTAPTKRQDDHHTQNFKNALDAMSSKKTNETTTHTDELHTDFSTEKARRHELFFQCILDPPSMVKRRIYCGILRRNKKGSPGDNVGDEPAKPAVYGADPEVAERDVPKVWHEDRHALVRGGPDVQVLAMPGGDACFFVVVEEDGWMQTRRRRRRKTTTVEMSSSACAVSAIVVGRIICRVGPQLRNVETKTQAQTFTKNKKTGKRNIL